MESSNWSYEPKFSYFNIYNVDICHISCSSRQSLIWFLTITCCSGTRTQGLVLFVYLYLACYQLAACNNTFGI